MDRPQDDCFLLLVRRTSLECIPRSFSRRRTRDLQSPEEKEHPVTPYPSRCSHLLAFHFAP